MFPNTLLDALLLPCPGPSRKRFASSARSFLRIQLRPLSTYDKIHDVKDARYARSASIRGIGRSRRTLSRATCISLSGSITTTRRCRPGPGTGTLQVNPATGGVPGRQFGSCPSYRSPVTSEEPEETGLFSAYSDDLILSSRSPGRPSLLPSVRAVRAVKDLISLGKHLPAEADEALLWLAEGIPPEEVRDAVATTPKKKVDPKNLVRKTVIEHTRG